jgi:hypothetical protein
MPTIFPCASVAVVPDTHTFPPTRTAREYPITGSQGVPLEIFVRAITFLPVEFRPKQFHPSRFSIFHLQPYYGSNRARNSAGTIGHKSSRRPNTR